MTCSLSKYYSATPPRDSESLVFVQPVVPSSTPRSFRLPFTGRSISSFASRFQACAPVARCPSRLVARISLSLQQENRWLLSFLSSSLPLSRLSIVSALWTLLFLGILFLGRIAFFRACRMDFARFLGYSGTVVSKYRRAADRRGRPATPTITRTIG